MDEIKRKRGRPPGSKNKKPAEEKSPEQKMLERVVAPSSVPMDDYRHADPMTLVGRLYSIVDWQSQALMNEMRTALGTRGGNKLSELDVLKAKELGTGLEKALASHKRAVEVAKSLKGTKTPEEYLRLAIDKIKAQSLATISEIIKELREHRRKLGPMRPGEAIKTGEQQNPRVRPENDMQDAMERAMAMADELPETVEESDG